jgi:hypothetical protein
VTNTSVSTGRRHRSLKTDGEVGKLQNDSTASLVEVEPALQTATPPKQIQSNMDLATEERNLDSTGMHVEDMSAGHREDNSSLPMPFETEGIVAIPPPDDLPIEAISQPRHRSRELEWRRTHQEMLRTMAGEWVVLEGEEIIGHGKDLGPLVAEARARGIVVPYAFFVEDMPPP